MAEVSGYHPDMFIWVDETGSDRRNSIRNYVYALRGMRPVCHRLSVGGRCVSAIPVLTTWGIEEVFTTTDRVNGDMFERFICESILQWHSQGGCSGCSSTPFAHGKLTNLS